MPVLGFSRIFEVEHVDVVRVRLCECQQAACTEPLQAQPAEQRQQQGESRVLSARLCLTCGPSTGSVGPFTLWGLVCTLWWGGSS